jgi:RHS repeat-associated protein
MGALAVKPKLASGLPDLDRIARVIEISSLAADALKENRAANDELAIGPYYDGESGLIYNGANYYDPKTGRWLTHDGMSIAEHFQRYRANMGRPGQPPFEGNPFVRTLNNPLRWIDPTGFFTEVTIWDPVGFGSSSFGHVSTNINGQNFSFGPGGWDKTYPNATDYNARQQQFRGGAGHVLGLTPEQEAKLAACLQRSNKSYSAISNNCGDPIQNCLNEVGVPIPRSMLPNNLGKELSSSPIHSGTNFYPGPVGPSYPSLPMVP